MPIFITDIEQGSEAWFKEKLGKPSSSKMSEIITGSGGISKSREGYLYTLAAELITGVHVESYKSSNMQDGNDREHESRTLYSLIKGVEVEQVGMVYKDEKKEFLCSPDGIINREYGLELKNVLPKTQVKYLLEGKLPPEYYVQVMASLYITGFKRWDFMSYSPGLPPLILSVERNIDFMTKLGAALNIFNRDLNEIHKKLLLTKGE